MNKNAVITITIIMLAISGCQSAEQTAAPDTTEPTNDVSDEWITPGDNIDITGMNLYWQQDNLQFIADENAKLSIYVEGETNENGELLFDDGQDWLVLMETALGDYPLFPRSYVQLGGVSCAVFNEYMDDSVISHVIVTIQQTAGYQICDYKFDSNKNAFKVIPIYDAGTINFITKSHQSP